MNWMKYSDGPAPSLRCFHVALVVCTGSFTVNTTGLLSTPAESFVVGDKQCDIEMGRRAGATTLLVRTGWGAGTEGAGAVRADHVVDDLLAAARIVLARARARGGREG